MGGSTVEIDKKTLEDAVNNALKGYFPRLEPPSNVRVEFYNKFQHEADEYDRDLIQKHNADLDTTLIFAGLFSAVTSAFIIAIQTQIQPDYTQLSYDVLVVMANANHMEVAPKPSSDSPWTGPDPTLTHIQCVLFSSLAASLLAAFVAMLGKQWLNRYSKIDMRGSLIDRSRDRQRKINGMATWGFSFVMESLPLMLQAALLLLGYALSHYLFTIDKTVAAVIIGFTGVGLLFYVVVAGAAIISYNCPFQTPISLVIRFIIDLFKNRGEHLERFRKWFRRVQKQMRANRGLGPGTADGHNNAELGMTNIVGRPPTLFDKDTDWEGYVLDSNCIAWMFEMSMDADVILNIIKFIPEIVWHDGIQITPLERLYDTVVECFDRSCDRPVVIPKFRDKAYLSAKAFLHVAIQRKCMGNAFDEEAFDSILGKHKIGGYEGDADLESTLGMIDRVLGVPNPNPIRWKESSDSHRDSVGPILLYRAWESVGHGIPLPEDIREFALHMKHPPPAPIVTNCLLIVGLLLNIELRFNDQQTAGKSYKFRPQIETVYEKLIEIFQNSALTVGQIDRALEAMELIIPLSKEIATRSYRLFRIIMHAKALQCHPEKKLKASRLAMRGAYTWDEVFPRVGDPQDILTFLDDHFKSADKNQEEPIQNALRALGSVSGSAMNDALNHFDPTQHSFVHGICFAFRGDRPLQLRKAALSFLPLIADRWFDTPAQILKPEEMQRFCKDWASAVDDVGATNGVLKDALAVLFNMMNSQRWRPHIVDDKWKLLEDFISYWGDSDMDNTEPLRKCLNNQELIDTILEAGNPDAKVHWLAILWLKFDQLAAGVKDKLTSVTRNISMADIDWCLSMVESKFKKVENKLLKYTSFTPDHTLIRRRDCLQQVEKTLKNIKRARR